MTIMMDGSDMVELQKHCTENEGDDNMPQPSLNKLNKGSQCITRPTHEEALTSSPLTQWQRLSQEPGHAMMLMAWNTFCCLVEMSTTGTIFAYGWSESMIPWPFVVPAINFILLDGVELLAYSLAGPLRTNTHPLWPVLGAAQALQNAYMTFTVSLVPVEKKPFMKVWPALLGFGVIGFTARTQSTIAIMNDPDPMCETFSILRNGIIGGAIASIRTLDSITDLQVGYLLVQETQEAVCFWKGEEAACRHMFGLAITQIVLSVVDFFIGLYLQFNDMKLSAETSITWTKLAVHVTSLICEVGMMGIYIISSIFLRTEVPENNSPAASGHMFVALVRASAKVARATASMSAAAFRSRASHSTSPVCLVQQQTDLHDTEELRNEEEEAGEHSAAGDSVDQDREIVHVEQDRKIVHVEQEQEPEIETEHGNDGFLD